VAGSGDKLSVWTAGCVACVDCGAGGSAGPYSKYLPSARSAALGKGSSLPSAADLALGKGPALCRVPLIRHSAKAKNSHFSNPLCQFILFLVFIEI
jgi:hypothetical protein